MDTLRSPRTRANAELSMKPLKDPLRGLYEDQQEHTVGYHITYREPCRRQGKPQKSFGGETATKPKNAANVHEQRVAQPCQSPENTQHQPVLFETFAD